MREKKSAVTVKIEQNMMHGEEKRRKGTEMGQKYFDYDYDHK
jgi:hypothetical protein